MKKAVKPSGLRVLIYLLLVAVLLYVVVYMPTPYLVYQPGSAEEVKPMITVEEGDADEQGAFMLTTVSASYANMALIALSAFNPNAEIVQKEEKMGDQSREEYNAAQVYYMNSSQSSAVEAAYQQAGVEYSIIPAYMFVMSVPEGSDNVKHFRPGDKLISVDGEPAVNNDKLAEMLQAKQVGETVEVKMERSGKTITEKVKLVSIKDSETGKERPGLGVMIVTMQKIEPSDPEDEVYFADTEIGGPSAGLMFALEIYNQLTPGDLTKGYRVAGTGTIVKEGTVGPIGGVKHKIVAADREEAEYFLVPRKNYEEAKAKADRIGTEMELVPVDNLQDAVNFLDSLSPKE